jgi:hypothetical protein
VAELALAARAAPLFAVMLAGCGGPDAVQAPGNLIAQPKAEPTPTERAERLVRERLNAQAVSFEGTQVFVSEGATVVCGRYRLADRPAQRFIAVGEEDVFVEGEFTGDMDQAVREICRNA